MLDVIQDLCLLSGVCWLNLNTSGDRDPQVKILKSLQIRLHTNQYPVYHVCEFNIFEISHFFFCSLLHKTPHYSISWCLADIHCDQLLVLRDVNKFCTNKLKWRIKKNKHLFIYIIVASLYCLDRIKKTLEVYSTLTYAEDKHAMTFCTTLSLTWSVVDEN